MEKGAIKQARKLRKEKRQKKKNAGRDKRRIGNVLTLLSDKKPRRPVQ